MSAQSTERIWYKAKLLPAAQSIFTDGFYPEAKQRTGSQYVYFTQLDSDTQHSKVLVASRLAENSFRMMTLELAQHFLAPQEKASRAEASKLNEMSENFSRNF